MPSTPSMHATSRPNLWQPRPLPLPLSITYDTLPRRDLYQITHIRPDHTLITVSDRLAAAEVDAAYRRYLDPRILTMVVTAFGVGDPADPDHWHRWWDPDAIADWGIIHALEISGHITPWPHGR